MDTDLPVHDVLADSTFTGWPRLTCRAVDCREATIVRQPWMSDAQWTKAQNAFREAHGGAPNAK